MAIAEKTRIGSASPRSKERRSVVPLPRRHDVISTEPQPMRWTIEQYKGLGDAGVFGDKRVELIEGAIYEMSPIGVAHWVAVNLVTQELNKVFATGFFVSAQNAIEFGKKSQPQPDVAVFKGSIRDFKKNIPHKAVLIIEVSDSTLKFDRTEKMSLYAKNKIAEYWLLNLKERKLEIYRAPFEDANALHGWSYSDIRVLEATESIAPLSALQSQINVADLLP